MQNRRNGDSGGWQASLFVIGIAVLSLGAPLAAAAEKTGGANDLTRQIQQQPSIALPSLNPLVERVLPAVVSVSAQLTSDAASSGRSSGDERNETPFDEFLKRFFENRGLPQTGPDVVALGSGFIIDRTGYIVTNNHVAGKADKVTVIFQDESRHDAKIVGRDEKTDIALLKIDAKDKLPFVSFGDSDEAKVGDWVMAVGNPFSLGGTVTAGIISALGRNINAGPYDDFIQIDAPINRGNSGGPTFNLKGEVIGINTAIYSPNGGSVGIGFAVPSNTAKSVIAQLKENGSVRRGWLGVAIQGITPEIAKSLGMNSEEPSGALVASVTPNSPAAKAGLHPGDVIIGANGRPVKTMHDVPRLVAAMQPGQELNLSVRRGGKETKLSATVGEMPQNGQQLASRTVPGADDQPEKATSFGLEMASIDAQQRREFRIPRDVEGVVVTQIAPDSPAKTLGIRPGDVIESIDQQPVKTPREAAERMKQAGGHGNILLLVNRNGMSQFVAMSVGQGEQTSH
jgi:serine protease Do